MKILVIGKGWTGNKVYNEFLSRNIDTDILSHNDIPEDISQYNWVVNCAGVTGVPNVDACQFMKDETIDGNTIFPVVLYKKCHKQNVRFAHFSSGCIYSGIIEDVNEDPNFFGSIYSLSKGVSDTFLKDKAVVFRIRMPFTNVDEPKNYLTKIKNYATNGKLYDSSHNSLTDLNEAVKVACDIVLDNSPDGPYNLVNQGSVTMRELVDIMKLDVQWFTDEEFANATVAARSTCVIPAYHKMRPLIDALKEALQ